MKRNSLVGACQLLLFASAGCVAVDPRADYGLAREHIAAATGVDAGSDPDAESAAAHVEELLADGLTADEAVQAALLNNPRARAAFAGIGMARADVVQSGLFSNPSLSLAARFPDGGGLANIDAGLGQNIAELWLIPVRKRAAEEDLGRRVLAAAREVSLLALAARSAYFRAVSGAREREIAAENRDVARQLVESAEARQQAGVGNSIDVNLARAGFLDTDIELRAATLAEMQAKRELGSLMGLAWPPDADLVEPLPEPPAWTLVEDHLVELAQAGRLDLLSADRAVASAMARLEQEKRSVFANVEVGVAMERSERRRGGNNDWFADTAAGAIQTGQLSAPAFSRSEDESQDVIAGPSLSLDLPIFDQNRAQIAKAQYAVDLAKSERDALAVEIAQETRSAYDRARTAWGVASLYRDELVPLLQVNLELSREAYRAGNISFLSVLETQRQLLLSRARFIQALRDATTSLIDLERAAGRPLRNLVSSEPSTPPADPSSPAVEGK